MERTLDLTHEGAKIGEVFVRCMFEFGGEDTADLGEGKTEKCQFQTEKCQLITEKCRFQGGSTSSAG